MSVQRSIVQKLFESKGLYEAEFSAGGSTYKCAFGRYYKDGEEITRDDYFKAKEEGGISGGSAQSSQGSGFNVGDEVSFMGDRYKITGQAPDEEGTLSIAPLNDDGTTDERGTTYVTPDQLTSNPTFSKKSGTEKKSPQTVPTGKPKVRHFVNERGEDVFFITDPSGKTILTDKDGKPLDSEKASGRTSPRRTDAKGNEYANIGGSQYVKLTSSGKKNLDSIEALTGASDEDIQTKTMLGSPALYAIHTLGSISDDVTDARDINLVQSHIESFKSKGAKVTYDEKSSDENSAVYKVSHDGSNLRMVVTREPSRYSLLRNQSNVITLNSFNGIGQEASEKQWNAADSSGSTSTTTKPSLKTNSSAKIGKSIEDKSQKTESPENTPTIKMDFKVVDSNDYFEESEADYKGYTVGRTHSKNRGTDYYTIEELRGPQFSSEEEVQSIINDYQRRREEIIDYSTLENKGVDAGVETYKKLKKSIKKKSLSDYYLVQRGRMATLEKGFNLVQTKNSEEIDTQLKTARDQIIKSEDFREAQKVYKEKIVPYMYATGQCKSGMAGMAGFDSYTVSPDSEYSWSSMMKQNATLRKHKPVFYK